MRGQWVGQYVGTNQGLLIVDLDETATNYIGHGSAFPHSADEPGTYAAIKTVDKQSAFTMDVTVEPLHRMTGNIMLRKNLATDYPKIGDFPVSASLDARLDSGKLYVHAKTNINTEITAVLYQLAEGAKSSRKAMEDVTTWQQFKEYVAKLDHRRYLFRGQKSLYPLRTSFHRTGRADIERYRIEDIPLLHKHLSARTKHLFNLDVPDQYGAFLNLAQHHGYPTPLLDWSYSPFVAAFFAFRHVSKREEQNAGPDDKVRIFMFDRRAWHDGRAQVVVLRAFGPNVTAIEFNAIENERLIPQQSVSTITNVDDIEAYIDYWEKMAGATFLFAIDLPRIERTIAMRELSMMGITAGSLFPGLDGACEELKERYF